MLATKCLNNIFSFTLFLFIYPFLTLIPLYLSSFILYSLTKISPSLNSLALKLTSVLWQLIAKFYNGHEIVGLENLPKTGPGLIIFYHGQLPLDIIYLMASVRIKLKRTLGLVADRTVMNMPGLDTLRVKYDITDGSVDNCTNYILNGNLLAISPGGMFEAQFADCHEYEILWKKRMGYAKIAHNTSCPVYIMFTRNCRQLSLCLPFAKNLCKWLYEKTRLPLRPLFGIFPVKLITYISEPIFPSQVSPEEFDKFVRAQMLSLIRQHQELPGSMFKAHAERLFSVRTDKTN